MQVNVGGGVQNMLGGCTNEVGGGGGVHTPPRKSASAYDQIWAYGFLLITQLFFVQS